MEAGVCSETPVTRHQSTRRHTLISSAAIVTKSRSRTVCTNLSKVTEHRVQHSTALYIQHARSAHHPARWWYGGWVTEFRSAALRSWCGDRRRLPVHLTKLPTHSVRLLFPIINWPHLWSLKAKGVPWLRRSVDGLASRRPGFDPSSIPVGFVVDELALQQLSVRVLRFYPVDIIAPLLHAQLLPTLYLYVICMYDAICYLTTLSSRKRR
jgi:hypothetical protein